MRRIIRILTSYRTGRVNIMGWEKLSVSCYKCGSEFFQKDEEDGVYHSKVRCEESKG